MHPAYAAHLQSCERCSGAIGEMIMYVADEFERVAECMRAQVLDHSKKLVTWAEAMERIREKTDSLLFD